MAPVEHRDLPPDLADLVAGRPLVPVTVGRSASVVARVEDDGGPGLYLKLAARVDDGGTTLADEVARLEWLQGRAAVPEVVAHGADDTSEWMVTTALEGTDASVPDVASDPERLARLLGETLRTFHDALDAAACPFDARTGNLVAHARRRVAAGRVDPATFEPIHQGTSAAELLGHVEARRPADPEDLVVTHGDFCLPNVLVANGQVTGIVDVGLLGVGDRYRDLGIGARSVARNIGAAAVGPFIDAYGIAWPDLARIDFFVMLDELF